MDGPAPLLPTNVDLRDFEFIPMDVRRVLNSDTWLTGTGDQRAATMALWLESWHQLPAASLPSSEQGLAQLSHAGAAWKRVRAHALRGWVLCTDGRLYHPVVAAKALEAWLEKLASRKSSGAGNAKRWHIEFDAEAIEREMDVARDALRLLDPNSRAFKKQRTGKRVEIPEGNPGKYPDDVPSGSRQESRHDRKRQGDIEAKEPPIPPKGGTADGVPSGQTKRQRGEAITLRTYLDRCREAGVDAIGQDDEVFRYADRVGLPRDFVAIEWQWFRRKYATEDTKQSANGGWPKKFRNAVMGAWGGLWAKNAAGEFYLTTPGKQAEADMHADQESDA